MDSKDKVKVCVMLIATEKVMPECLEAVKRQDYPNFEILINLKKPDPKKPKYHNIVDNANECRIRALKTDADYFWMLDDDVIPKPNALSELMLQVGKKKTTMNWTMPDGKVIPKGTPIQEKHVIGGWWQHHGRYDFWRWIKNKKRCNFRKWLKLRKYGHWSCGSWVADNTFANYYGKPYSGLTEVDKVDFGCILISREVLTKFPFENSKRAFKWYGQKGEELKAGACHCLMFSIRCQEAGYRLFMNGNVVCKHKRRELCQKKSWKNPSRFGCTMGKKLWNTTKTIFTLNMLSLPRKVYKR